MLHSKHEFTCTILAFVVALLGATLASSASPIDDAIETTFVKAVVKIDVSSNTPVFKDNVNICVSEGTGFLVTPGIVVTAEHVFKLDPTCGERIILVKSKSRQLERLATVVAT